MLKKINFYIVFAFCGILVLLIFVPITIISYNDYNSALKLKYSKKSVEVFMEKDILGDIVSKNKYSKTMDTAITDDDFDYRNIDYYMDINYIDIPDFISVINKLKEIGYSSDEVNLLLDKLKIEEINFVISQEKIIYMFKLPYFDKEKINRYVLYMISKILDVTYNLSIEDAVTYVNANLDYDFYTNINNINNEDAGKIDVLVNKYNKLDNNFVPSDLVMIDKKYTYGAMYLKKEAKEAYEKMAIDMLSVNLKLHGASAYRSYDLQTELFMAYSVRDGVAAAETYSARPGHSEHQTGLAIDVSSGTNSNSPFESSNEFTWLLDNSYKYGFILRYLKESEHITGYIYEPWHYRYVGIETATYLYNNNLTYDEYIARNLNK